MNIEAEQETTLIKPCSMYGDAPTENEPLIHDMIIMGISK